MDNAFNSVANRRGTKVLQIIRRGYK